MSVILNKPKKIYFFYLFKITDVLLHNYVQHEKRLPSVTKNYEPYYSVKMVD